MKGEKNPHGRGCAENSVRDSKRSRLGTNTHPNGTEANAAGKNVRACVARESKREKS